jgi:NAD(P)-dependent dehydrogenase (short-subunit alcohol dehydrogenase family)
MAEKSSLKTVLITGGATGIGLETGKALLQSGEFRLLILGRSQENLNHAAEELQNPELVSTYLCDLRDSEQIRKTLERITAVHKNLYGLVNNAGVYPFGGIASTSEESWDDTFDVNLKAPFLLIQALVPLMARNRDGGRIVNVSSTAGLLPNHFALAYSVSKAAMIQLTKTLAKELGKDNITVNCVCPGIVRTPLHEAYHQSRSELEEFYARRGAAFPLGRIGDPADVAGAIKFFLSPDASWVTGDVLVVDGGRLLL